MVNMSRDYAKKLKAIRNAEKLTQAQFSQVTGVSVGTIGNYESGYKPARIEVVEKVIQVERFEKYTMWILHDKTFPAAGQVAPALSRWLHSVGGRSGFNRHYPKITPISSQCWLTLYIERVSSRRECTADSSVGGANHVY